MIVIKQTASKFQASNLAKALLKNVFDSNKFAKNFAQSRGLRTTRTLSDAPSNKSLNHEDDSKPDFGLLFDIDGVLLRGRTLLPHTRDCFKLITDNKGNFKVPTLFVTNAGNELRSSKAAKLSHLLGVYIHPDQVIMSHSPLKMLKSYHNKRCLISGQGPIIEIAKNLGFTSVITVEDLRRYHPHLDVVDHKRRVFAPCVLGRYFPPIEAIVLFGESVRWETNLQLITDTLMSNGQLDQAPKTFPTQNLPVLACNTDLIWMAEASMPRFGHGTFLHCLEQIYQKLSGKELKYGAVVGKPSEITYYYAEQMIREHARSIGINRKIKNLYAIGDNLDTDIYGANVYNQLLDSNRRLREKKNSTQQKKMPIPKQMLMRNSTSAATDMLAENGVEERPNELNYQEVVEEEQQHQKLINSKNLTQFSYLNENGGSFEFETESIRSILVCTGVYQGKQNEFDSSPANLNYAHKDMVVDQSLRRPNFICSNSYEAVKLVYQIENYVR